jgi:hypothetical protein
MRLPIIIILLLALCTPSESAEQIKIGRVKYSGGGDWYNDPSSEVNLLTFMKQNTSINADPVYEYVDLKTDDLFKYPILFLTGHGNVNFSDKEAENLRTYLENGGFLYIDDDYGLDRFIRKEMKKVFPNKEFMEIPFSHPIYTIQFDFSAGPPKIHEHDGKPPQSFGIFVNDRLAVFYTYETNPSDGWADADAHGDSAEIRELALKFGTNIILWALMN